MEPVLERRFVSIDLKINKSEKNSSPSLKEHSMHSKKNFMSEQNI